MIISLGKAEKTFSVIKVAYPTGVDAVESTEMKAYTVGEGIYPELFLRILLSVVSIANPFLPVNINFYCVSLTF